MTRRPRRTSYVKATPRNKRANSPPVIASAAKQSRGRITRPLDCFVARAPRNDGVTTACGRAAPDEATRRGEPTYENRSNASRRVDHGADLEHEPSRRRQASVR